MCAVLIRVEGEFTSRYTIRNEIGYIIRKMEEIPDDRRIFGAFGTVCSDDPQKIIHEFMALKRALGHDKGRLAEHIVLSFGEKPPLDQRTTEKTVRKIVGFWAKKYQVFFGVHEHANELGQPNWHIHILISLSDLTTGKKGDILNKTLLKFKKKAERAFRKTLERERERHNQAMEGKS